MDKLKLMEFAVELLENVEVNELESLNVSQNKYDDGSTSISIEMAYPATETEE